ncbi:hypothetical protein KAH81_10205 [bacterium]|nr:hypothetical protein [bacterium]
MSPDPANTKLSGTFRSLSSNSSIENFSWFHFGIILAVSVLFRLLHNCPGYNEFDVLAVARHFADPDWISGDWYLGQRIGYRYLFNIIAGFPAKTLSFLTLIFFGRLILLIIFSIALTKIIRSLRILILAFIPLLAYFITNQSLFAQEWMIGGLETKAFAYAFILLALAFSLERKAYLTAFFLGLSFSFHILVGFYGAVCLGLSFLIIYGRSVLFPSTKKLLTTLAILILSGCFGIYSVVQYIFASASANKQLASELHVLYRVSHHVLPSAWNNNYWAPIILCITAFLTVIFTKTRSKSNKLITLSTLFSLSFFGLGIVFYLSDFSGGLRFYLFRFADVYVPFSIMLLVATFISSTMEAKSNRVKKVFIILMYILNGLVLIYGITIGYNDSKIYKKTFKNGYLYRDLELQKTLKWISCNTEKNAVFLIPPSLEEFYFTALRPAFVTLKHSPQNDTEIIEWFERIKLCNGESPPPRGIGIYRYEDEIDSHYFNLDEANLRVIASNYTIDFYLDRADKPLELPIVFQNQGYRLYSIRN